MTIEMTFAHYSGVITYNGKQFLLRRESGGRWTITDCETHNYVGDASGFRRKQTIDAIANALKIIRTNTLFSV